VRIDANGGGFTHGTPDRWPGRGELRMWTWLLVLFAGSYAEAIASGRRLDKVMLTAGRLDLKTAAPAIEWLISRGYADSRMDVLTTTHLATVFFLRTRWDAVHRVAQALRRQGRLTGTQVRTLVRAHPPPPVG
jgi:hypothetical protein